MKTTSALRTIGFPEIAARTGKVLTSIPMKDKSAVKILSDAHSFEVYQVKNGKVITACGMSGFKDSTNIGNFAGGMLEKIQKNAAEGIDVFQEWMKSLSKLATKQDL